MEQESSQYILKCKAGIIAGLMGVNWDEKVEKAPLIYCSLVLLDLSNSLRRPISSQDLQLSLYDFHLFAHIQIQTHKLQWRWCCLHSHPSHLADGDSYLPRSH